MTAPLNVGERVKLDRPTPAVLAKQLGTVESVGPMVRIRWDSGDVSLMDHGTANALLRVVLS